MAATSSGRNTGTARASGRQQTSRKADRGVVDRVRGRVSGELNARKNQVVEALDSVADAVRRIGEPFRDDRLVPLTGYAEGAADRIEQVAQDLRGHDVEELPAELREWARRRPAVFAGAGLAAGILAARFLKSSADAVPAQAGQQQPRGAGAPKTRGREPGASHASKQETRGGDEHGRDRGEPDAAIGRAEQAPQGTTGRGRRTRPELSGPRDDRG